ncbi:tumor necrosis factor receptor superfamily member 18 isoform X3 [Lepidochelys kempii]|uniref:tumor necrosis factor receptor superfamily member 18 isoform X3 n=1 Tax=Lepidochelys kempii TaxID=8472 RepID=UPI003C700E0F
MSECQGGAGNENYGTGGLESCGQPSDTGLCPTMQGFANRLEAQGLNAEPVPVRCSLWSCSTHHLTVLRPEICMTLGLSDPCPDILKPTCKCSLGYQCSNLPCTTCRPLPQCKAGTELNKSGTDHFKFTCEPCKNGTYSDTLNSCCRPWTNCKNSGLRTIRPGNHTHNVECGIFGAVTPVQQQDSKYTTILAILTALGVFILILMTFFLHLCLWTLKKEKLHIIEALEIFVGLTWTHSKF